MAQLRNAANIYQQNAINTASPARLTLMLYEGAIRFCNIARDAMAEEDYKSYEKININVKKAQNIIVELRSTLDMKYPVAKEFDNVYDYVYRRLYEANMQKDLEAMDEVIKHLKTMRDTWKEVMKINHVS